MARLSALAALVVVGVGAAGWWAASRGATDGNHSSLAAASADAGVRAGDAGSPRRADPPPAGTEALRGTVVDASADPVAGALITVGPERGADPVRETETGADGRFEVTGLAAGVYRVAVEGAAVIPAEVRRVDVPGAALTVMVARRVIIEGVVTDEGVAAAGASVEVAGPSLEVPRVVVCGPDGRFLIDDLPEGAYALSARRGARAARAAEVERFGIGPWDELAVTLGPAAVVEGRVIDALTRAPLPGAHVWLTPDEGPTRTAVAAEDGTFALEGVLPGPWAVDAIARGYLAPAVEGLEVAAGRTLAVEVPMAPGGVVVGRVVDARGEPVAGARVELEGEGKDGRPVVVSTGTRARRYARAYGTVIADGAGAAARPRADFLPLGELGVMLGPVPFAPPVGVRVGAATAAAEPAEPGTPTGAAATAAAEAGLVTGADGAFRIDALPAGRFVVRATHPDFAGGASAPLSLASAATSAPLKIVLVRGATVAGRVLDASGVSSPGARVTAWRGEELIATVFADESGRYQVARLTGKLELRASDERGGEGALALTVGDGDDGRALERDLRLEASGGSLDGAVSDPQGRPIAGVRVTVTGRGLATTTDGDGRFTLVNLPAGALELELAHPDWPRVRLGPYQAGARGVRLALRAGGGIDGLVRDAHTRARIAAFTLRAEGPAGETRVQTHRAGEFELAALVPGRWTLGFTAPGYAARRLEIDVPAGREPRAITIADLSVDLAHGAIIAGTVYDRHGEVVRAATVECGGVRATTDKLGRYRLVDVPTGDVTVVASHPEAGRGSKPVGVRAGDEVTTLDVRLGD